MMLLPAVAPGTALARAATASPASVTTPDGAGLGSAGVCGAAPPGHVRCLADVSTRGGRVESSALGAGPLPNSYSPADLSSAYGLASSGGGRGHVLAVVLAYDDPSAEADLAVYRAQFSLPPCTSVNGCFRKVDQQGGAAYPPPQANWATETSLDLDMASAACPLCSILLVEANSDVLRDVFQAVHEALALGATEVSLSFGVPEYPAERQDDALFNHPGVPIVAAGGDGGYGVNYPAASPYVTAVGGTSLRPSSDPRGWSESAWSGGGSGCSAYETKPAWQRDTGCSRRTVVDVSAVADPGTGVAVYDSYANGGWMRVGGTSAGAPIVAGGYALRGATRAAGASGLYVPGAADDVVSGSNGVCTPAYLCTAQPGYDGPTGMGSIHGTAPPAAAAGTQGFVSRVYRDLLGRPPDAGGLAYWSGLIDAGQPRYPVATSLTASTEYRGLQVQALYSRFLQRPTDGTTGSGGEGFWVGYIARGATFEQLAESLIGSDEYFHLRGHDDNLAYVRVLYNDILGRGPEPGGLAYWGGRLDAGAQRYLVSASILTSTEGYQNLVRGVFQHFLGHQPDPAGLAYWTGRMQSGLRDELLIASVIATDEYLGRH